MLILVYVTIVITSLVSTIHERWHKLLIVCFQRAWNNQGLYDKGLYDKTQLMTIYHVMLLDGNIYT